MYGHPNLCRIEYPKVLALTVYSRFFPGAVVEHRHLPGVALVVTGGPESGVFGQRYSVRMPGGKVEKVLENNLMEVK